MTEYRALYIFISTM